MTSSMPHECDTRITHMLHAIKSAIKYVDTRAHLCTRIKTAYGTVPYAYTVAAELLYTVYAYGTIPYVHTVYSCSATTVYAYGTVPYEYGTVPYAYAWDY